MPSALVGDQESQDLLGSPTQLAPRALSGGGENAELLQLPQGVEGGWPAKAQASFDRPGVHDRLFEYEVDEPIRPAAGRGLHRLPVTLSEVAQPFRSNQRVVRLGLDAVQEQPEPAVEVAPVTNPLERVVVRLTTALEEGRKVQQRRGKPVANDEEEHDQETADTAIAVEERVDRLELVVHESRLDERRELRIVVDEALEIAEQTSKLAGGWRNERRRFYRRAGRPDPVLRGAELAGLALPAAHTGEEYTMHFPDEAGAERQCFEPPQAKLHRPDVVHDLLHVGPEGFVAGFGVEDLHEGGLRTLDPSGRDRLPAQVGLDKEMGIREESSRACEPSKGSLGIGDAQQVLRRDRKEARQGPREVGDVTVAATSPARLPVRRIVVLGGVHGDIVMRP